MKQILLSCAFLMCGVAAIAQPTVTNAWFIRVNDLIYGATDSMAAPSLVTPASANAQTWNFTALNPMVKDTFEVFAASTGANAAAFPTATFRVPFMGGDGYGRVTATRAEIIGFSGDVGLGSPITVAFSDPMDFQQAPMTYGTTLNNTSNLKFTIATADYPQIAALLTAQLPAGATCDSIRLTRSSITRDVIDAHGTANLTAGNYPVLRLNRFEEANNKIELHVKLLAFLPYSWLDPSSLGQTIPGTGKDTTYSHLFVSNNERQPVVTINLDKATQAITSVRYLYSPTVTATNNAVANTVEMIASPNPANQTVRVSIGDLPKGSYALRLQNILGQTLHSEYIGGNETTTIDVSRYQSGLYMYSVTDAKGMIIAAKRLHIVH
jgi:Secretion system C-terminal sorting domain